MFKYFLIALLVLSLSIGADASYSIKNNHKIKDAINLIKIWMDAQKDYEEIPGISIAIVHNHNDDFIHQSMQKNVNEFDIDNDGIINRDDNCIFVSNPGQEDVDGDENGGDACDPCDSANIFTFGNVYGDYWEYDGQNLSYNVNIFDVMRLIEIVETSNAESCGYEAGDLTGEGEVNIFDIYALVGYLMDGLI